MRYEAIDKVCGTVVCVRLPLQVLAQRSEVGDLVFDSRVGGLGRQLRVDDRASMADQVDVANQVGELFATQVGGRRCEALVVVVQS